LAGIVVEQRWASLERGREVESMVGHWGVSYGRICRASAHPQGSNILICGVLLVDALRRSLRVADSLGVVAMEVRARTERARVFYARYGFVGLEDDPLHLYLPLATARTALGS
jgi:hypothetical protein